MITDIYLLSTDDSTDTYLLSTEDSTCPCLLSADYSTDTYLLSTENSTDIYLLSTYHSIDTYLLSTDESKLSKCVNKSCTKGLVNTANNGKDYRNLEHLAQNEDIFIHHSGYYFNRFSSSLKNSFLSFFSLFFFFFF